MNTHNPKFNQFIRDWHAALCSGKYKQCHGVLESTNESGTALNCCLGVGQCVLGIKNKLGQQLPAGQGRFARLFMRQEQTESDPTLRIPKALCKKARGSKQACAAELNDNYSFTFKQIAACIRFTYPLAFRRPRKTVQHNEIFGG